jgi:hypothetical protein
MPPIAQRLREPAAFVLLAFGALSTLFNTITFLFGPGENNIGLGGGPSFSDRAAAEVGSLLSVVVVAALVGSVYLAHWPAHLKQAKVLTLMSLITLGVADLFGVVALFSAFGANGATGWDKTSTFFISLGQLGVAGIGSWLVLGYFQQHQPAKPAQPAGGFQQPQQWGPGPQQQQWQQPPAPQQQPQGQPQQWGPPPQQQAPQTGQQQQPPQPQWGQPQQQDADAMMTQAIPTVPPAQHGQQQQQQPPQQDGGLGIGNWTSE